MKPDAPVIHVDRVKAQSFPAKSGFRLETGGNVLSMYHVDEGDIATGFKEAEEIFEDIYTSQKIQHGHLEPHAALAYWEPSGKLVIYTSTQNPSLVRAQLADLFNLPQSKVRSNRSLRRRRLWRENASALGAIDGNPGAQGASTGAVGAHSRRGFSYLLIVRQRSRGSKPA